MTAEAPTQDLSLQLPATVHRLVLTGFMGAGKSSVGRLLAAQLSWNFLDLDAHLEARTGASIAELFSLNGEARFRRLESSALAHALSQRDTVLALGGGTPELLGNRLLLEQTPGTVTIFLQASFSTLFDRCMLQSFSRPDHIRPVLSSPAETEARFHQREPLYRRMSQVIVNTADLSAEGAAQEILGRLNGWTATAPKAASHAH